MHLTPNTDWPRTARILPWLAAASIATVILVPIDSIILPVPLPFDARPDRLLLVACFALWALVIAVHAPSPAPGTRYRFGAIEVLLVLFAAVAVLSVGLNLTALQIEAGASLALRKLILLASYLAFYLLVVGTVRRTELSTFVRLVVALGVLAAVGTIIQYASGRNLFFTFATALTPPGTSVSSSATLVLDNGRPDITGPARHGLAVSTMLAMILPLALVGAAFARDQRDRVLYGLAAILLLIGCVTTLRRTGVILPFLACAAVIFGGGRRMLPLAAVFVVLLAATPLVVPGVFDDVRAQFSSTNTAAQQSLEGRTTDFPAVAPDIRAHALVGRGFGTYNARRFRILDSQYLTSLIETGFVGTGLYLALIVVAGGMALWTGVRHAGPASWIGLAAFGSALAFLAANAFFDTLAFPQAPYVFLLVVALASIARQAAADQGDDASATLAL